MLINPSFGFNINGEQIGRTPVPQPSPGPMPTSASISPRGKLEELRSHFNTKYRDYEIIDRPLIQTDGANLFIPFDGRLNFVNIKHKDLFFQELQKLDDKNNLYGRCRHFYRKSDNCLLKCWLNQYSPQTPAVLEEEKLVDTIFLKTMPKDIIIFPYINQDFSKWPNEEKIRFYVFLKNAGGDESVKSFDAYVTEDIRRREKSFITWACGKLDIVSNAIEYVNIPERLFQKLDEIVIPKILNIKEADKRHRCLYSYGCFIGMRNAINPISWLSCFVSPHKLSELWDKLVSFFKMEGSADEFALTLGQIMGTAMGAPLGVRLIKLTTPKAISALKGTAKKLKITAQKLDKAMNETFNTPKKPVSGPKKPSKTREQGRLEHIENRKKNTPKRIARKPEKPPQKTGTPLKLSAGKNFVIFGGAKLTLERALEMTKKCFYGYKECLKNKSALAPSEKIKLKSLKTAIKSLRYKTETLLNEILKLKPPAHIEFECNRFLCLLKIDSYNWDKAIFYFKQMFSAYKKMGKEQTIKHVRLIQQTYKNIQKGLENQNELLKNSIHDMVLKINSLLKNADKLKTKITVLELDIQKLIKKLNSLKDTKNLVLLEKEYAVKSLELNVLKNRYESLKISFSKLKGEKPGKKLREMKKLYRKDLADLEKELARREENLQKIKNQINEFKAGQDPLKKSLAIKSAELDALKKRKDQILETIKQLRKQESKANAKIGLLKKIYDQIQIQLQLMRMSN